MERVGSDGFAKRKIGRRRCEVEGRGSGRVGGLSRCRRMIRGLDDGLERNRKGLSMCLRRRLQLRRRDLG
jgi:hypothetical protein